MKALKELELQVEGMTCGSCVRHVGEAVMSVEGACDVDISLREGTVKVFHEGDLTKERVVSAIREAGYDVRS